MIEFENGTQWLRCVQGAPVPHGVTGAEMTDRRIPRSRVARTVEGPPTRPKERTTQTHPAHRTGSLQDTPTDGRQTHGLRLTMNCASELEPPPKTNTQAKCAQKAITHTSWWTSQKTRGAANSRVKRRTRRRERAASDTEEPPVTQDEKRQKIDRTGIG